MEEHIIHDAIRSLFAWAKQQNFMGNDPHDLLTSPFLRGHKNPIARLAAVQLGRRSPIDLRFILRVPKAENAKALSLFITGLLRAKVAITPDWGPEAEALGKRLIASQHKSGGWGYPFPWQSRTHFLPAGSPNIVTTAFAANALVELYGALPSEEVRAAVQQSANYILNSVSRINAAPEQGIAFGYAENDPQIVFNASLLGAECLLNAGTLLGNPEYLILAKQAADFVASHQKPDGSWEYGLEPNQTWIDSFHTGFVIVSMKHLAESLGDAKLLSSATTGFEYYSKTFIEPDFAIKYFSNKRYPIDAHALGQAMVTLATFGDIETAKRVALWSIANMRSDKGYFYYQYHQLFTNRIPYLRWSNSWMFRGLSELIAND